MQDYQIKLVWYYVETHCGRDKFQEKVFQAGRSFTTMLIDQQRILLDRVCVEIWYTMRGRNIQLRIDKDIEIKKVFFFVIIQASII